MAGGLESIMQSADPTSDMPALQQVKTNLGQATAGLRSDAAIANPNDIMNQVIVGADRDASDMLQYKQSMLQAQQAQQAQQAEYMKYLQGLKNPERDNWDAIGKMGTAMAMPNTSATGNQFASGLQALQGATEDRNARYDLVDKAVQQQLMDSATQQATNAAGNYKDSAAAYNDKLKSIIDYQKAIKTAQGNVDPGELAKVMTLRDNAKTPEEKAYVERLIQMKYGGEQGKLMANMKPQFVFGTPEYAVMAEKVRLSPSDRLKYVDDFVKENTDAYVNVYGPAAREKLYADAHAFVSGALHNTGSAAPTTTTVPSPTTKYPFTPENTKELSKEASAVLNPAREATSKQIIKDELAPAIADAIKKRDAAPVGSQARMDLNQAVIALQNQQKEEAKLSPGTNAIPMTTAAQKEAAKAKAVVVGEAQGKSEIALPSTLQNAIDTVKLIEQLDKHPGKAAAVGFSSVVPSLPGGEAKSFELMLEQIQNKTFLDAFEKLKGAGAITDFEGKKATSAVTRLSTALSEDDFQTALDELKEVIRSGEKKAYEKAGKVAPTKAPTPVNISRIPKGAIAQLKANPHEAALFDEQFGAGASQSVLGKK